jgi:hypothetical protein
VAYSFAQLEGLWIQAGGNRTIAPVMAAIALAESRGDPNATGAAGEKGLWQILPRVWGSLATYDPLGNARGAVHILHAQGLTAWTTYTNGAYKHFLSSAAPQNAPTGTGQGSGTTAGSRGSGGTSGTPGAPNPAATKTGQPGGGGILQDILGYLELPVDAFQAVTGAITNTEEGLLAIAAPAVKFAHALDWFFVPSHWIRIFAGLAGIPITIGGVFELSRTGDDHPAALPIGIALTGGGLVLLFIAFHNLDPSITTVGELLADVQGKAQTDLKATVSPAAAVTAAGG